MILIEQIHNLSGPGPKMELVLSLEVGLLAQKYSALKSPQEICAPIIFIKQAHG